MRNSGTVLLLLGLFLGLAGCGSPSASTPSFDLPRNQVKPLSGELTGSDPSLTPDGSPYDPVQFTARAGERLEASLSSDQFDAYLILQGPDGKMIAADDDAGGETDAQLSVVLVADGQYRLLLNSFAATGTGDYRASLTLHAAHATTRPLEASQSRFKGELSWRDGLLSNGQFFDAYTFSGQRGQLLLTSLQTQDLDTYLRLVSPEGNILAENDDRAKDDAASQLTAMLPAAGRYTLLVSSLEPVTRGPYRLRLQGADAVKAVAPDQVRLNDPKLKIFDFATTLSRFLRAPLSADPLERTFRAVVQVVTDQGTGSGTLISPDGLLLTNFHVIRDETSRKPLRGPVLIGTVQRTDEPVMPLFQAQILRYDQAADLALLKVTSDLRGRPLPSALQLPTVPLADAETVRLGDGVRILGFPSTTALVNGSSYLTFTQGVISSIIRNSSGRRYDFLSDAVIHSGNSGGAALNAQGELIGIPSENLLLTESPQGSGPDRTSIIRAISALPPEWQPLLSLKRAQP